MQRFLDRGIVIEDVQNRILYLQGYEYVNFIQGPQI
jgi:hypothetical protein